MGFNSTSKEFMQWFNDSVELLHELTSNITDDERRQLTSDPGNQFKDENSLNIIVILSILFSSPLLPLSIVEILLTSHPLA